MELKRLKYINNTRSLPKYDVGKADWGSAASSLIGAGASIYNAHQFDTTSDDYVNKYGASDSNIGGIGYTRYNDINQYDEMNKVKSENTKNTLMTAAGGAGAGAATGLALGATIGSIAPGVGTVIGAGVGALGGLIGGLFGASSRKRKARRQLAEAQQKVDNFNEMNRSEALTTSLQMEQAEKYGDTRSQFLGYSEGKPSFVHTAEGLVPGIPNADTNLGETIANGKGDVHVVKDGPNDSAPSNIKQGDWIFGKTKDPEYNQSYEDLVRPAALMKEKIQKNRPKGVGLLGESARQTYDKAVAPLERQADEYINYMGNRMDITMANKKYKCGKPKFAYGLSWVGNAVPSAIGALASLDQYFSAKKDKPYMPNTYVGNKFQNKALSTLGSLSVSPYPIIQQLRDAEARTNYAVDASGGLSTAQKNIARIASLNGTQQQIGNLLANIQQQNNAYKSAYANAMLQSGESEAQRRQAARQYDLDYYSKAHGARQQMMQTGLYNFINNVNQYAANEFKRKNAIANLDLYTQQQKIDSAKLDAWLKGQEKNNTVVNNWTGGVPYVLSPEIMDNIPGAFDPPSQGYKPDPNQWNNLNKSKTSWVPTNNPLYKYWE